MQARSTGFYNHPKMKTILFSLLVLIGLQFPTPAIGGSFLTSFDFDQVESNGVRILSCPSRGWSPGQLCGQISVITWDLGQTWPDNGLQHKLKLDLLTRQDGGVKTSKDLPLTSHQRASVQFYAPDGISDHIDLGILAITSGRAGHRVLRLGRTQPQQTGSGI